MMLKFNFGRGSRRGFFSGFRIGPFWIGFPWRW